MKESMLRALALALCLCLCLGVLAGCTLPLAPYGEEEEDNGLNIGKVPIPDDDGGAERESAIARLEVVDGELVVTYTDGTSEVLGALNTYISNNTTQNEITITPGAGHSSEVTVAKAMLSTVAIQCAHQVLTEGSGGYYQTVAYSAGSGVIYTLDKTAGEAYIITNFHVVYHALSTSDTGISHDIQVYLWGAAETIPATYVGGSSMYDIAVLKVTGSEQLKASYAEPATLADSNGVCVGEGAYVVGNPAGLGISATAGIISVDSEYITMDSATGVPGVEYRVMRIDAAVNGGNSGGGLYNSEGKLLGIVNAKIQDTDIENIGYAIPVNVAVAIAENILDHAATYGCVRRALMGITIFAESSQMVYDTASGTVKMVQSIAVQTVNAGGLGEQAGIQVGDVLVSIQVGDRAVLDVTRQYQVIDELLWARAGTAVTVVVQRGGQSIPLSMTVTAAALTTYN
ncbi:MAG: trypsin-like peptidase domain-containing protein [Clostridia bacterium]|nr:trypsin-like peptidase domain-containing protein [Clostridia bacterium]